MSSTGYESFDDTQLDLISYAVSIKAFTNWLVIPCVSNGLVMVIKCFYMQQKKL